MMKRHGRKCKQLLGDLNEWIQKMERGRTTSYSVENSLLKRVWICSKPDYRMNDITISPSLVHSL
jgi:hypothetical protein